MTAVIHAEPLERLRVGVGEFLIRLRSEDTGGQLSIVEFDLPAGAMGAMPHIHEGHSEDFVIVAGEVTFDLLVDGAPAADVVAAGGTVSVPPGVAHGFRNDSGEAAKVIGLFRPGGYEQYFRDVHEMVMAGHVPTAEDLAVLRGRYRTITL
jgi:quercetin dioxygenase-like cupin family protein